MARPVLAFALANALQPHGDEAPLAIDILQCHAQNPVSASKGIPVADTLTVGGVVRLLKKEHNRLSKEIKAVGAALIAFGVAYAKGTTRRGAMSAAGARIAAAQRARWAKAKAESENPSVVSSPKKRSMSASARKRIAAAQRARWAKVKATKKKI